MTTIATEAEKLRAAIRAGAFTGQTAGQAPGLGDPASYPTWERVRELGIPVCVQMRPEGVPAYAMALTPGVSRMYLGQHWASDIFAGAFLGTFYGWRIVQYSHAHERTPVDRVFLPRHSVPVGWTVTF